MAFVSNFLWTYAPVEIALKATVLSLVAIGALILFIWLRRNYRARYFARRDAIACEIRANWDRYMHSRISPKEWQRKPLQRELLETILLDQIDVASPTEYPALLRCLRQTGLLDLRIYEARYAKKWKRQVALVSLGRMRAKEAIPALSEAMLASDPAILASAVRGLGHIGIWEAAAPILNRMAEGGMNVPPVILKNSLVNCCRTEPSYILKYITGAKPDVREILARVLAEIASPWMGDDMAILAADPLPEVRASAARALAEVHADLAVPLLATLTMDTVWFVRLRAVNSLAALHDTSSIETLIRTLCDTNRVVRQRAAIALIEFDQETLSILDRIVTTEDRYALHAFISELQRRGRYADVMKALELRSFQPQATRIISAVQAARHEIYANLGLTEPELVSGV